MFRFKQFYDLIMLGDKCSFNLWEKWPTASLKLNIMVKILPNKKPFTERHLDKYVHRKAVLELVAKFQEKGSYVK